MKNNIEDLNCNNLEETIKFIFQIKEKEVFDNEYEMLTEEMQEEAYEKIKPLILSNFNSEKIKQLNQNYSYSNKFLKYSNENFKIDLSNLIDINQYTNTRNLIFDKFRQNLNFCKNSIKEDLANLSYIGKKRDRKNDLENKDKSHDNSNNINNIDANVNNVNKKYSYNFEEDNKDNVNNKTLNLNDNDNSKVNFIQNKEFESDLQDDKNLNLSKFAKISNFTESEKSDKISSEYNLKITYFDGNDSLPQKLKIKINRKINFENFIFSLKKKLGIYEYAKFRLVSLKKNNGN